MDGLGWVGWDLCAGLFYEHRFAMLIIEISNDLWRFACGDVFLTQQSDEYEYANQLPVHCQVQGFWLIEWHISNSYDDDCVEPTLLRQSQWKGRIKDEMNVVGMFGNATCDKYIVLHSICAIRNTQSAIKPFCCIELHDIATKHCRHNVRDFNIMMIIMNHNRIIIECLKVSGGRTAINGQA